MGVCLRVIKPQRKQRWYGRIVPYRCILEPRYLPRETAPSCRRAARLFHIGNHTVGCRFTHCLARSPALQHQGGFAELIRRRQIAHPWENGTLDRHEPMSIRIIQSSSQHQKIDLTSPATNDCRKVFRGFKELKSFSSLLPSYLAFHR